MCACWGIKLFALKIVSTFSRAKARHMITLRRWPQPFYHAPSLYYYVTVLILTVYAPIKLLYVSPNVIRQIMATANRITRGAYIDSRSFLKPENWKKQKNNFII